jgi:hypothetical protein
MDFAISKAETPGSNSRIAPSGKLILIILFFYFTFFTGSATDNVKDGKFNELFHSLNGN